MKKLVLVLALLIIFFYGKTTGATTINFDDVPSGTIIDNQYSAQGAIFSTTGDRGDGHAYAIERPYSITSPNIIGCTSASSWFNYNCKGIATFLFLSNQVGIYAIPEKTYTANWAWMKAYNSSGIILETAQTSNLLGDPEFLYIDRPSQEIAYVEFMAKGNRHVYFDSFSFQSLPEPSTLLLLGTGLVGLAIVRKWMKKYNREN